MSMISTRTLCLLGVVALLQAALAAQESVNYQATTAQQETPKAATNETEEDPIDYDSFDYIFSTYNGTPFE